MRIRVSVDVRLPFKRSKKIQITGGAEFVVNFRYERLPTFCFPCGKIGDNEKFCSALFYKEAIPTVKG